MAIYTQICLSLPIYILLIRVRTFTIICNMLFFMTQIFHSSVINIFGESGSNLLQRRMHTSILHSKNYLEAGSRWFHLRNLWKHIILSMPYTFGLTPKIFYGTRNLSILVINTSTTLTNILMDSQSSATLILEYFINDPLAYKIRCPKLHLAMGPKHFPHNHIKVSQFIFLVWYDL